LQYDLVRDDGILGPGFLPLVSGAALAVFGLAGVWGACLQQLRSAQAERSGTADGESADEQRSMTTVVIVFALMAVAIVLAPIIGFFLSFGGLVFVLIACVEKEKLLYALLLAFGAAFLSWLVFYELLRVAMPIPFIRLITG